MATAYGNQVAYGSGGWFRAVIDVWDDGANTGTSTTVHYQYSVQFGVSVSDSTNTVAWWDPWGSGSANNSSFSFGSGGGQKTVSGPHSNAGTIQYGGGNVLTFVIDVAGIASSSATSRATMNYYMPARLASPPDPPAIAVGSITSTSALPYSVAAGAENGATTQTINYRIHRASDGAHMGDIWGGYGGVTFTNLARNTGYVAYAQAYNSAGWGGWSAGVGFTTLATAPDAPTGLYVTDVTPDSASAYWTAPADGGSALTSYTVQTATDFTFTSNVKTFSAGALTGLAPGTVHYLRVRANNAVGAGAWSSVIAFETLSGAKVKVNGGWVNGKASVKVDGSWRNAKVWKKQAGAWVV